MDILLFLFISPFGDSKNSSHVLGKTRSLQFHGVPFLIPIISNVILSPLIDYPIVQREELLDFGTRQIFFNVIKKTNLFPLNRFYYIINIIFVFFFEKQGENVSKVNIATLPYICPINDNKCKSIVIKLMLSYQS